MVRRYVIAICLGLLPGLAVAQETVPVTVTFVTSSGFWEDTGDTAPVPDASGKSGPQRGYYKLIALRQPDGTSHIVLQQIALDPSGPRLVSSAELEEFSKMRAFVTDIRPESSDGLTPQPGLFATVYLRTDPAASDVESWTVLIDELGDIRIERASN